MQKLFALFSFLFFPALVLAFVVPAKPTGFVQDYAGMLSPAQINQLETKLEAFEKNSTNEIAVVTVPSLDGDTVENVAQDIFTKWGIGKAGKNNGVLLLVSLSDRKTRIHTGYGVEGDLTDIATSYIQSDVITPAFRSGDYYGGINSAVDKMIQALGGQNVVPENGSQTKSNTNWEFVFWFVIVAFQVVLSALARSKSWWGGGVVGGVAGILIWHFFVSSVLVAIPSVVLLV
ncbi:MAG: TPM domain-containing protein, partial [Nitrospira sp.]